MKIVFAVGKDYQPLVPFLSAGSFLKERLKYCCVTSLAFETQGYYDFLPRIKFYPCKLNRKDQLSPE